MRQSRFIEHLDDLPSTHGSSATQSLASSSTSSVTLDNILKDESRIRAMSTSSASSASAGESDKPVATSAVAKKKGLRRLSLMRK